MAERLQLFAKMHPVLEQLTSPLNLGLLALAAYLVYQNHIKQEPPKSPPKPPKIVENRDYTPKELIAKNGQNDSLIYIAVKGKIYDVSSGKSFYGPGSAYENFAGRDASRGLAKNSFSEDTLTSLSLNRPIDEPIDTLKDLNPDEVEALEEWSQFFASKYPFVGQLIENNIEQ